MQDLLVELFLLGGHVHTEDLLYFGRQGFLHVLFYTTQKEGLKHFVQALVAIVPALTMLIFKILPQLKPETKQRYRITMSK